MKHKKQILQFLEDNHCMINSLMSKEERRIFGNDVVAIIEVGIRNQIERDGQMQFIKAKFLKDNQPTGRAYTYRTEDAVKAGDMVTDAKGSKLMVVDEPVDAAWIKAYGVEKVGIVKKYVELESGASNEN